MEKYKEAFLIVGVMLLMMFPYIWQGQGVQVNVWDNLDSNVVWYKMLKDQGKFFAGPEEMVEGFVIATPRFSYPSGWNVEAFLYFLMAPFTAYWLNKLLITIIGFVGMLLFLRSQLDPRKWELSAAALLWATLAFNPHIGISVAGLPLLLWSFVNLLNRRRLAGSYCGIIFYSLYSSFVLAGVFTILFLIVLLIYWQCVGQKVSKFAVFGVFAMMLCYSLQEYNLFYFLFLQDEFLSHRQEMDYRYNGFSNLAPWGFVKNGDHNSVFYWWGYIVIFFGVVIYPFLKNGRSIRFRKIPRQAKELLVLSSIIAVLIPFLASFLTWNKIMRLLRDVLPFLHSFNLTRITFLLPFFIFIVVGYGLAYLRFPYKKMLFGLFLTLNVFVYQFEWRNLFNQYFQVLEYKIPSYREFYAGGQFREIKEFIGENWDEIRIGSVNLPPAVSVYNGFHAIDGYLPLYSLDYKHRFKEIIDRELNKDSELFEHYQYWGNKCYLQNATYPDQFDAFKWKELAAIESLDFDFEMLKSNFDTQYLLSAVEIDHEKLKLLNLFIHNDSAWDIYLYQIK